MRWGIISTGAIANDFALALKKTPKAVLHAVASRSQASADEFAAKHGCVAYSSYEALAADAKVDIAYIATPNTLHCENILMCLEAGKHVLCEKPMVISARQAERCIAKAKEKGLFLMEGMWTRFFPAVRVARKAVDEGKIGKVVSMTASLGFKAESHFNERLFLPELAGGALFDLGIYAISLTTMILGTPSRVTAHAQMRASGVDNQTFVTMEYESGAMAHVQCSFAGCLANEIVIAGETGVIRINRPIQAPETSSITTRQGNTFDPLLIRAKIETVCEPLDPPHFGIAPGYNFLGSQGFHFQAAAVQEAVEQGLKEHPEMPMSETLAITKVIDDVRAQIGLRFPGDEDDTPPGKKQKV